MKALTFPMEDQSLFANNLKKAIIAITDWYLVAM